jgi:hypothetical protein
MECSRRSQPDSSWKSGRLLAADGLESTVTIILDAVLRLAGAETAGLFQPDASGQLICCTHATGLDATRLTELRPFNLGEGVAGLAVAPDPSPRRLSPPRRSAPSPAVRASWWRKTSLAAGMDDYVSKPITIDGLRAVLERWLPLDSDASPNEPGRARA